MIASPELKAKIDKAKDYFSRLGFLTVKKRDAVLALLKKYGISPEKANVGHTIKAIATALKTNDQFTKELAALLLESEKKTAPAKKPSNFDGSADTVIQVAKDLKEAASIISPDDAGSEGDAAAKKVRDEKNKKILMYFLIALAIIAAAFLLRKHLM